MRYGKGWTAIVILAVLTPLGLLAVGAAWGEWGLDTIKERIGYEPEGMKRITGRQPAAPLPDYEVPGLTEGVWRTGAGTVLSALLGAAITAGAIILLSRILKHGGIS